jgi:leucyl-tRNA synthetase
MSKSRGNVVSPDDMIARYGADATRMYTLFAAPPDRDLDWNTQGVEGIQRFLGRVYRFVLRNAQAGGGSGPATPEARAIERKLHQTIQRVTDDFASRWHFNTSVAAIMELVNDLYAAEEHIASGAISGGQARAAQRTLVLLLAPFAPYLAHELWETLGEKTPLLRASWPRYDAALAKAEEIEIVVQINGKVRSRLSVPAEASEESVRERALSDEKVRASLDGKQIVKAIVVPGKLVNLVVR